MFESVTASVWGPFFFHAGEISLETLFFSSRILDILYSQCAHVFFFVTLDVCEAVYCMLPPACFVLALAERFVPCVS